MAAPLSFFVLSILGMLTNTVLAVSPSALIPFAMDWASSSFGPDGPWNAVQINIGTPNQPVALYPGGTFRSHFLTPEICANKTLSPGLCYATAAGLYSPGSSTTALTNIIQFPAFTDFTHGGLQVSGTNGLGALDSIAIGSSGGSRRGVTVPNVTIAIHDSVGSVYPGGSVQALQVGTLGLGYLGTENQSFSTNVGPVINGSLIPGYLEAQKIISSNSFGLHIGSAHPKIPGSLYFGGYDQNRICGNVTTQQGAVFGREGEEVAKGSSIDLLDISINVIKGSSPWNTSTITGLLASKNSSIGSALPVLMLPEAPYLDLPQSTCDAIASWLPLTYRPDLGLYTWNTAAPQYNQITTSASALSFTFRKDQVNTQNITISIPFVLLNLTLERPLVTNPIPYFPCNAQSYGSYSLGRAFLQAAFLGANWNVNNNQGVWWLAQAPGPNISAQGAAKILEDQDAVVEASSNSWEASWEGAWTSLNANGQGTVVTGSGSTGSGSTGVGGSESAGGSSTSKLGTGAKAGIGAGVAVVAFVGVVIAWIFARRRRSAARQGILEEKSTAVASHGMVSEGEAKSDPTELQAEGSCPVYELRTDSPRPVYELR